MEQYKYKKDSGTAGVKGQELEYKYLTLLFLRCLSRQQYGVDEFRLAANFKAFEKKLGHDFQDIGLQILQENYSGAGCSSQRTTQRQQVFYLQLKHKDTKNFTLNNLLNSSKGDFSLPKYYEWFLHLGEQFVLTEKTVFPNESFDDITFVIFTTAGITGFPDGTISWHVDELLSTSRASNKGDYFIVSPSPQVLNSLPGDDTACKESFLDRLRIYAYQAKETLLADLIKQELRHAYGMSVSEVEAVYLHYLAEVSKWWKLEGNAWFLTQRNKDAFLLASRSPNVQWSLVDNTTRQLSELRAHSITFEDDIAILVDISANHVLNIQTDAGTSKLALLQLVQMLENAGYDRDYVITTSSSVTKEMEILETAWNEIGRRVLIIMCEWGLSTDSLLDYLIQLIYVDGDPQQSSLVGEISKKIIFLDLPSSDFVCLQGFNETEAMMFKEVQLTINMSSLSEASRELIIHKALTNDTNDNKKKNLKQLQITDFTQSLNNISPEMLWLLVRDVIAGISNTPEQRFNRLYNVREDDPSHDIVKAAFALDQIRERVYNEVVEPGKIFLAASDVTLEDCIDFSVNAAQRVCGTIGELAIKEVTNSMKNTMVMDLVKNITKELGDKLFSVKK